MYKAAQKLMNHYFKFDDLTLSPQVIGTGSLEFPEENITGGLQNECRNPQPDCLFHYYMCHSTYVNN